MPSCARVLANSLVSRVDGVPVGWSLVPPIRHRRALGKDKAGVKTGGVGLLHAALGHLDVLADGLLLEREFGP